MGEREDILRRAVEQFNFAARALSLPLRSDHIDRGIALVREAAACPPDDAQQRLDDCCRTLENVTGSYQVDYEKLVDAQQRLDQIASEVAACQQSMPSTASFVQVSRYVLAEWHRLASGDAS